MTYEEYAKIRDLKGLSDYKVSQLTGIGRATFSEWKNGKYQPKIEKINAIKECLGIKESDKESDIILQLGELAGNLVLEYRKLSDENKKQVERMIQYLLTTQEQDKEKDGD